MSTKQMLGGAVVVLAITTAVFYLKTEKMKKGVASLNTEAQQAFAAFMKK